MGRLVFCLVAVTAAGCATHHSGYYLAGECDPPTGGTEIAATASEPNVLGCNQDSSTNELVVADSVTQWNAAFDCGGNPPPTPTVDFATSRAAIAHIRCTPLSLRFASETPTEVVIGIVTGVSGACIGDPIVVPLAKSTKPVRLAQCAQQCDDCPPVP
jgi:hypothetical protein